MVSSNLVLTSLLAAAAPALAQQCDCYLIDGEYPTYFTSHGWWDFRSLSGKAVASPPPVPDTPEENMNAPVTSDFFGSGSDFASFWGAQNWKSGDSLPNVRSKNNLYIEADPDGDTETYLTMRTAREPGFQSSAEFESLKEVDHASMRMRARTRGSPGACTAMFTYLDNENPDEVQETDIEVLTRDPDNAIHYTNQPSYLSDGTVVKGASHNITMAVPWTEWADHRLDWIPGRTTWSLDGDVLHSQAFQAPVDPASIVFNAWSDGGEWTGEMPEGGVAYQHVQWVEIAYGVTDKASCQNVCSIDEPGSPVML